MSANEDTLGGQTKGENNEDLARSLGEENTQNADTNANSREDQSTSGDIDNDLALTDDDAELIDLSDRYTIERTLGKGGMGEVFLAFDTRLKRNVAIKRILAKTARSRKSVQRFLTEAQSIAALNHPNIVQIYDYGRNTEGPFLIMECVQGGSLLDKCKEGAIELNEAVDIFSQLCDGLAKAHAANIIHRDIKPANILLTEDGISKLTDFGLAKDDASELSLTRDGAVVGTPDYMSPEQRQAAELTDHRSDLWSLAATFYQMLSGKSPKIIKFSDVPMQLHTVMEKALEDEKELRFQSALEMKEAVQQALTSGLDLTRDLGQGECPSCGKLNPTDVKFCTECTAAVEVMCLSCDQPMQIWNKACGQCGTLQLPLIEEKTASLQQAHDLAEEHLADYRFDEAIGSAQTLEVFPDPRFQRFIDWKEEFISRVDEQRASQYLRVTEIIRDALSHEEAYDYDAAIKTLDAIPESLFQVTINEINETAQAIKERLAQKQSRLNELNTLRDQINSAVNGNQLKDLLPVVQECLALKADQEDLVKLQQDLIDRQAQLDAHNQQTISQAQQYMQQLQFDAAVQTLNTITPDYQTETTNNLTQLATRLSVQRQELLSGVPAALANKLYQVAIENIGQYLAEIAYAGLQDPQLQQMFEETKAKSSASIRNKKFIKLGIAAAGVVVALITGMIIKANLDAKALEAAIAKDDWQTVLELDPSNTEGIRLKTAADKAAAEEAAAIEDALENGDWQTALEIDPENSEALLLKSAAGNARKTKKENEGLRLKADDKKTVGFVTNGFASFWVIAEAGARQAAEDFGVNVEVRMPLDGQKDQKRMLEELVADEVDGIAVSPIAPDDQTELLNSVAEKTNLITHDADAPNSNRIGYVGMSNYIAGRMCGELVKEALPDGGSLMIFIGRLEHLNARQRRQGVIDELLERDFNPERYDEPGQIISGKKYAILGTRLDDFDFNKAKHLAEDAIVAHPDMGAMIGLFAYNPPKILEALASADKIGQIKVIGFDEADETLQAIKDGHCSGTVVQNPYMYGYKSVEILTKLANDDDSSFADGDFIDIPSRKVVAGDTDESKKIVNVDEFWKRLKQRTNWRDSLLQRNSE